MNQTYCNNCGKHGHIFNSCKIPITSYGVVVFRINPQNEVEYLMVRRKDTLGYVDFMRGKYSIYNKYYIMNMIKQMTRREREGLLVYSFSHLWDNLWGNDGEKCDQYFNEEQVSGDKFNALRNGVVLNDYSEKRYTGAPLLDNSHISANATERLMSFRSARSATSTKAAEPLLRIQPERQMPFCTVGDYSGRRDVNVDSYSLKTMVDECNEGDVWEDAEWGFPKGRRNYQEKDYDCAVREFCEETGYVMEDLVPIHNMYPFEEIFIGSNYKSYRHKYYLNYMEYATSLKTHRVQECEISCENWETYEKCMEKIRHYNLEKKRMLTQIHETLRKHDLYFGTNSAAM